MNEITGFCHSLAQTSDQIPESRKLELWRLSRYISQKIATGETARIIVICTHNSRRSHIGQIMLAVAADYYGIPNIHTFSGGTEATAFNIRAVRAFRKLGFGITPVDESAENPRYQIRWKDDMAPYEAFSKTYDEAPNPRSNFAAVMVCSQADEGCPLVAGCDFRIALPYEDPKTFDDTEREADKYDERIRQIGREMVFAMGNVATAGETSAVPRNK